MHFVIDRSGAVGFGRIRFDRVCFYSIMLGDDSFPHFWRIRFDPIRAELILFDTIGFERIPLDTICFQSNPFNRGRFR